MSDCRKITVVRHPAKPKPKRLPVVKAIVVGQRGVGLGENYYSKGAMLKNYEDAVGWMQATILDAVRLGFVVKRASAEWVA